MNKIALVTGGMGGLGSAMCKFLAKSNHLVITTYSGDEVKRQKWHDAMKRDGYDFKIYK